MAFWDCLSNQVLARPAIYTIGPIRKAKIVKFLLTVGTLDQTDIPGLEEDSILSHLECKGVTVAIFILTGPALVHTAGRHRPFPHELLLLLPGDVYLATGANPRVLGDRAKSSTADVVGVFASITEDHTRFVVLLVADLAGLVLVDQLGKDELRHG
jgi:hypothetical protein